MLEEETRSGADGVYSIKPCSAFTAATEHEVGIIFFTDEKLFTVAPPMNSQNDWVYAPVATKKHDVSASRFLRTRPTFSKSVLVSVAVSKLGCTNLIFVDSLPKSTDSTTEM